MGEPIYYQLLGRGRSRGEDNIKIDPGYNLEGHPLPAVRDYCLLYWQSSSISGGSFPSPQPEDAPCLGDKGPLKIFFNS
jgi:hypothetical protein